jgi:thiamine-phosphate pyrophosphorylase
MRPELDLSLYLVTDRSLAGGRPLEGIVDEAVRGGVTLVQLREKDLGSRDFLALALRLKDLLAPRGIPLIINDRMDIALACGAEGLHIGQGDLPADIARKYMGPDAVIGLSVESARDARLANGLDIDYIGISPVYTTPTKAELTSGLGLEGVAEITGISRFPAVGIGGMNASTAAKVIRAGADGVAVVSYIVSAENPRAAAELLAAEVAAAQTERLSGKKTAVGRTQ